MLMMYTFFNLVFYSALNCFIQNLIVPCGKFGSPYLGKAQQPEEQRYPFLSGVCSIFVCPSTYVDAFDYTRGLYGHCKRVCTGS